MSYGSFKKITEVTDRFGLHLRKGQLFKGVLPVEPNDLLVQWIQRSAFLGYSSEKERSERIVAPVLSELCCINEYAITMYSGRDLSADPANDLNGECDFLLSYGEDIVIDELMSPIFSAVEAKKQDMEYGTAQCAAQLYGVQLFNAKNKQGIPRYYGCATSGVEWRFLKLEAKTLTLDIQRYSIFNLGELLGVLQFIVNDCKPA
jgi:hypothetical protein